MSAASSPIPWMPPGPVAAAFYEAQEPISVLMGPVAGGKTTVSLQRGVASSLFWPPTPGKGGLREVKFGIIRRLMTDLERTTMKSWFEWYPPTLGKWIADPPTHVLPLRHPDGGAIELTVEFRALGDLRIEEALRGYEPSYCYVDEVDLSASNTMTFLLSRAARFPRGVIKIAPHQVWGSCNAPEADSWVVDDFIDDPKPGHRLYRQPSGLSHLAENLEVLGEDYYRKLAETMPAYEAKRFIHNIPGLARGEEAVYDEFNPDLHVAPAELKVLDRPLVIGMDAGGTPAAGFWQPAADGQWRKVAELTTHEKKHGSITGPNRFGEAMRSLLAERFRGLRVRALADPSAAYGADTANGESSWIDTVARVVGIPVIPAPGNNDPTMRQEALRLPMTRMIDGRKPGLVLCPVHCRATARAFGRDYRWQVTGRPARRTGILKNWASHLVEADQYALLDGGGYAEAAARNTRRGRDMQPRVATAPFNPFQ